MKTTKDAANQILSIGDTVATPRKTSFDFAYEYCLADKVGVVTDIRHYKLGDLVIVDLGDSLGKQKFREFELTKL